MSIDRDEVSRIAALARLELHPDEVQRLTADMNRILEHAAHLGELAPPAGEGPGEIESKGESSRLGGFSGTETQAASRGADDGVHGGRVGGPGVPDRLAAPVEAWGPRVEQGFFVVPPLPGTRAGDPS